MFGHEVNFRRRDFFGRQSEIAFIFAVLVIHQNDLASLAKLFNRFLYACKWNVHRQLS